LNNALSLPVIAGLAIGIAFIALFAIFFAPPAPTPKEESTTVFISDFGLTTYYRFSDIKSKVVNFEVDWETSSILMQVDAPQGTELRIRFHEHLFEQLEHQQRPEGYRFGDRFVVFVDEEVKDVTWEYTELEVIAAIPLEAGTEIIEIVPISLVS
jgi:hypothetical protein